MKKNFQKLFGILDTDQRRSAKYLLFFMFIGMIVETMGIGLVIPAIAALADPNLFREYASLIFGSDTIDQFSANELLITGLFILVFVYFIKATYLGFLSWKQNYFVFNAQGVLSARMFKGYLQQPYTFHLQHNSSELIRNTLNEVQQFMLVILSATQLIAEFLVLAGIMILLLIIEPVGATIIITLLGTACLLIYRFTRQYMMRWGKARQYHEGQRLKHLQQGFGGIKEAKLMGRENWFLVEYAKDNAATAVVNHKRYFVQSLPRLLLEFFMVVVLVLLIVVLVIRGQTVESIITTIAVFAAAAFRVMPSINRVISSLNTIRYGHPVIETLHSEISNFQFVEQSKSPKSIKFNNELLLRNIDFTYENSSNSALTNISLSIKANTSVGFIGESGAGKSSLVDIILGLISPTNGLISIDGLPLSENIYGWQKMLGYVPQTIYLTDDSLRKNIAFGIPEEEICDEQVFKALKSAKLADFVEELPEGLDTFVGEAGVRLSGGQRQRIGIARALYHEPPVLVLDEATSALDNESEQFVMSAINALRNKKTIIIIAHRLTSVVNCDCIYRLEKGKIIDQGAPSEVL